MTLTTEQLRNLMEFNGPDHDSTSANADAWEVNEMAAELLANREAQPVIVVGDDGGDALAYRRLIQSFAPGTKLYTAPPAPGAVKLPATRLWAGVTECYEKSDVIAAIRAAGVEVSDD